MAHFHPTTKVVGFPVRKIVTAVDLSDESLKIARQRVEAFGFRNKVRFYNANVEDLSKVVPVEQYDLIYSFGVLHHTPNPERALSELRKYLVPGGTLKTMVYNKWSWKVFWIWAKFGKFCGLRDLDGLVARYSEAQTGCPVTYTYTRKSIRKLLKGFSIKGVKVDHIFPYKIDLYKEHKYETVWYFRYIPKVAFSLLEKLFGWHMCVTAERLP